MRGGTDIRTAMGNVVTAQGKSSCPHPTLPAWPAAHLLSCWLRPGPGADAETAELGALRRASYCVCIEGCSGSRAGDVRRFPISRLRALQPPANSWLGHVTADPPSASLRSGPQDQTALDCRGLKSRPAREGKKAPGGTRAAERAGLIQKVAPSFLDFISWLPLSQRKESEL